MNTTLTSFRLARGLLMAGALALLFSCGGGGGSGGGTPGLGASGTTAPGSSTGGGGGDGGSGDAGGSTGAGTGSTGGGGGGDSSASNTNGDGSGVGSGGTGATADATGIGAADGMGSVILNGLRYNTDSATFSLEDTTELQIGMSARIAGKVDAGFTSGIAATVVSAAELRGAVSAIDLKDGSFTVMGARVTTDNATVWGDAKGLTDLVDGAMVQVWGLPAAPGTLRATRVQVTPTSIAPLVTGTVQNLDRGTRQFVLGQLTIDFGSAAFGPGIDAASLANGTIVRVRGTAAPVAGRFTATQVQGWYAIPSADGIALQLAGVVTDFAALGDFRVLGHRIDARNAQITGGLASAIGNGVKVEVDGFLSGQVLVVKKLRIRYVPGTGGPVSFTVIGPVANYLSATDFTVRGQRVNASGGGTIFENGSATDLGNGKRVTVVGDRVVDGVLIAQRVSFTLP